MRTFGVDETSVNDRIYLKVDCTMGFFPWIGKGAGMSGFLQNPTPP